MNDETSVVLLFLEHDRRYTVEDLKQLYKYKFLIDVPPASIYQILEEAVFSNVCTRWVPYLLSDEHRTKRLDSDLTFLTTYECDPSVLMHRILSQVMKPGSSVWHQAPKPQQWPRKGKKTRHPKKPNRRDRRISSWLPFFGAIEGYF